MDKNSLPKHFNSASTNLYNGNIKNWSVGNWALGSDVRGAVFNYDQLNRLLNVGQFTLTTGSTSWGTTASGDEYSEWFKYDRNGNITNVKRLGNNVTVPITPATTPPTYTTSNLMDSLHYYNPLTNQLNHINDDYTAAHASNYGNDLETQGTGNYTYDAIGNMVSDASEHIGLIEWTTYGKVWRVNKSVNKSLRFRYGPTGERWVKMVYGADTNTVASADSTSFEYYVRDAQGNIMATYKRSLHDQKYLKPSQYGKFDSCIQNTLGANYVTFIANKYAGNAQFRQFIFDSIMSNTAAFQTVYENQFFAGKTFPDPNWTFQQKLDFLKDAIGTDFVLFSVSNYRIFAYRYLKTHIDINAYKLSAAADETEFSSIPTAISAVWNCLNGDNYKLKESFAISEWDIYGSKRQGVLNDTTKLFSLDYDGPVFYGIDSISKTSNRYTYSNNNIYSNYFYRYLGTRSYELSNHLGNVLATVSDRKIDSLWTTGNVVNLYASDIRSATDYFAFGWEKTGRNLSWDSYDYGFNGKPKDKETNYNDFGARLYDARVGRWMAVDVLSSNYCGTSTYAFVQNTPIQALDPDGDLVFFVNGFRLDAWENYLFWPKLTFSCHDYDKPWEHNQKVYDNDKFDYWSGIDKSFIKNFKDDNVGYIDGMNAPKSSAQDRYNAGFQQATTIIAKIKSGEIKLGPFETIKIVSHSQGGAYSAGLAAALINSGYLVESIYYIAPMQPADINHPKDVKGVQYSRKSDELASEQPLLNQLLMAPSTLHKICGLDPMNMQILKNLDYGNGGHNVNTFTDIFENKSGFGNVTPDSKIGGSSPSNKGKKQPKQNKPKPTKNTPNHKSPRFL